jgi:hypothetical protein
MLRNIIVITLCMSSLLFGATAPADKPVEIALGEHYMAQAGGEESDTSVIVKCTDSRYTDRHTKGDWITYECRAEFSVLKVERGTLLATKLFARFQDAWPTPESGIMLSKLPFPFLAGGFYRFDIDTEKHVPLVVHSEERSPIPPHGALSRTPLGRNNPSASSLMITISQAASSLAGPGGERIVEATPDSYVVAHMRSMSVFYVLVDKKTFQARWLTPPDVSTAKALLYDGSGSMKDALLWLGVRPADVKSESRRMPANSTLPDKAQLDFAQRLFSVYTTRNEEQFRSMLSPATARALAEQQDPNANSEVLYALRRVRSGTLVADNAHGGKCIAVVRPTPQAATPSTASSPETTVIIMTFYQYDERTLAIVGNVVFPLARLGDSYSLVLAAQ